MPQVDLIQTNFAGGEVSDLIKARSDIQKYANSMERMENFIPLEQGGALARSGTAHIDETFNSSTKTRLVPFEFSTVQNHVLEFHDLIFRVLTNEQRTVLSSPIVTPYTTSDLDNLDWAQSADTLYTVDGRNLPRKITRNTSDATSWTVSTVDLLDGPYFPENSLAGTTITIPADPNVTTVQNVTASTAIFSSDDTTGSFGTGTYDRHIRFRDKNDLIMWGKITGFVITSVVEVTFQNSIDGFMTDNGNSTTAATNPGTFESDQIEFRWRLGSFSTTTGFPQEGIVP